VKTSLITNHSISSSRIF